MRTKTGFMPQVLYAAVLNFWCLLLKVSAIKTNNTIIHKYFLAENSMPSLPSQATPEIAFVSAVSPSSPKLLGPGTFSSILPAIQDAKGSRSVGSYSPSNGENDFSSSRVKDLDASPDEDFESSPRSLKETKKKKKQKKTSESAEDSVSMEKGFQRPSRPSKSKKQGKSVPQQKTSAMPEHKNSEDSSTEDSSETAVKVKQEQGRNAKQEQINENTEELIQMAKDLPLMSRVKNKQIERQKTSQFQRQTIQVPVDSLFINQQNFPSQNLIPQKLWLLG